MLLSRLNWPYADSLVSAGKDNSVVPVVLFRVKETTGLCSSVNFYKTKLCIYTEYTKRIICYKEKEIPSRYLRYLLLLT